jgi:hypothetical protein
MRYDVDIAEVVLVGFGHVDRGRLGIGLKEELGRLLERDGLPTDLASARELVSAGTVEVTPGNDRASGRAIARGVHRGLAG